MFRIKQLVIAFLLCVATHAQDGPGLPLEQVPLNSVGTVSSVAIDAGGVIYVLQRGDKADPVIAVDKQGKTLRSWGKGMFTVPHSVRIDPAGNVWTVDAGSSMILKFTPEGKKLQEISVGEMAVGDKCLTPILCGTTDITFGPNGRLFISDGYGNARILEYAADGKRVKAWGSAGTGPGQFQIPHGIAYQGNTLYVADRQNSRVQRFDLDGRYLGEWTNLGRPFALKVAGGALWVSTMFAKPTILKVDLATGKILGQMEAPGPHSIDVNSAGEVAASGCCGGSNPNGFSWFRPAR
jgi:DNA-binding beta-propeller fold protein YncE